MHSKILIAIFCPFYAALAIGESAEPLNQDNSLRMVALSESSIPTLHPLMPQKNETPLRALLFAPIVFLGDDGKWQCGLCEKIPTLENGRIQLKPSKKDLRMTTAWVLSPKARWGNGLPMTGWDVKFTIEVLRHIPAKTTEFPALSQIEAILVDDKNPQEFRIMFKTPRRDHVALMSLPLLPTSLEEQVWQKAEGSITKYLSTSNYKRDPRQMGLYSGRYIIQGVQRTGFRLTRQRMQKSTSLPDIDFKFIHPNQLRTVIKQESADLVYLEEPGDHNRSLLNALAADANANYHFKRLPKSEQGSLVFNMRNPRMTDRRVRKALIWAGSWALEKILSKDQSFLWQQNLMVDEIPQTTKEEIYGKTTKEEAIKSLEAARWRIGADGLRSRNGETLRVELVIPEHDPHRQALAAALKEAVTSIGIDLTIQSLQRSRYAAALNRASFRDMIIVEWENLPELVPVNLFHSSQIPTVSNNYMGQNIFGWHDKSVDLLLERLIVALDPLEVKEIATELKEEFRSAIPYMPLYKRNSILLHHSRVARSTVSGFKEFEQQTLLH